MPMPPHLCMCVCVCVFNFMVQGPFSKSLKSLPPKERLQTKLPYKKKSQYSFYKYCALTTFKAL